MKRFYKPLKWTLLGLLGIIGIFLTVNGIRVAWAGHRLNERIEALRAAGQPLSLADLARPPIPPERNAATYLVRADKDIQAIYTQVDAAYMASSKADQEAADALRPTPAYLESMRAALAAYPQAIILIDEASRCPDYDPQLDFHSDTVPFLETLLEQNPNCRSVLRVCQYRVLVQLGEDHRDEAFETCLSMFRLARLFDRNPMLIGQLVGLAIRAMVVEDTSLVLQTGPLPASAYAALEQELARHDILEGYHNAIRSERAYGLQTFGEWASGVMAPTVRMMPWFKNEECNYLDVMEMCLQDEQLSNPDWNSEMEAAVAERNDGPFTQLLLPTLQQSHLAMLRTQAQLRALRVLNALLERERAGGAGEPALSDLGLPAGVATDPFNGEPLQLKKLPAGWLVYSVGANLKDDSGDLTDNLDVGVGPPAAAKAAGNEEAPQN
jgi:hypothetical protein